MIQFIQRSSIRRIFSVYVAFAALTTVAIGEGAFHLFMLDLPDSPESVTRSRHVDLNKASTGTGCKVPYLPELVAHLRTQVGNPDEFKARCEACSVLGLGLTTSGLTSGASADAPGLPAGRKIAPGPRRSLLWRFSAGNRVLSQRVRMIVVDSLSRGARAPVSRIRSAAEIRRLLAFVLALAWAGLLALGWIAVMAIRVQARRIRRYREVADARQRALEAAHEARKAQATFLGKVSHEINSPLQTILTNVQLLESRTGPDDRRMVIVRRLLTSVRQLRTQVTDLAGVAEMKSGSLRLVPENIDVLDCLCETVAVQESAAVLKGISLHLEADSLGVAFLDGRRLAQILTNLVSNAIRHTDRGEVRVAAAVHVEKDARTLTLVVSDTGCGMSVEAQKKLFEPFADSRSSRRGSGLGLSIVKGLVEQMQGTIAYSTHEGDGTVFTVTLPLGAEARQSRSVATERRLPEVGKD